MNPATTPLPRGASTEAHYGACDAASHGVSQGAPANGCAVVVCTRNRPDLLAGFLNSLAVQQPRPRQLVIVDSSDDERSGLLLENHPARDRLAHCVRYCRVDQSRAGLTRQRTFALTMVATDLFASFDDDIVLRPGCLAAMEQALRVDPGLVGVGACIDNSSSLVSLRWRLLRFLFVVPSLQPGRYFASGVSTLWPYMAPADELVEGDWLPGGAVMWRAGPARAIGYAEWLDGYGSGEDLEFSLRMARFGRLAVSRQARLLHLQDGSGRPDPRRMGFELLRNRIYIRRVAVSQRGGSRLWFLYGMTVETALEALNLFRPTRARQTMEYLRGIADCLREQLGRVVRPPRLENG